MLGLLLAFGTGPIVIETPGFRFGLAFGNSNNRLWFMG
jgi:hypothetical protein